MTISQRLAYSVKDAATEVGVSERKMRELISAGHIATTTPPGMGHAKVTRAELEAWLDSGA